MVSRKEQLPIGCSSNLISTARKNLRKDRLKQKLIEREQLRKKGNNQAIELQKADPDSNYKIPYFYKNGEEKIIPGGDFPEGILPVNAQETEKAIPLNIQQKPSFLQRIKKIFRKV